MPDSAQHIKQKKICHHYCVLNHVVNINFDGEEVAWTQATLPIKLGGLEIRSAVQLAPSAYLSSSSACTNRVHQMLPFWLHKPHALYYHETLSSWSGGNNLPPPEGEAAKFQRIWDLISCQASAERLLEQAHNARSKAPLLAIQELGAWLQALPLSILGLQMDDKITHIAVGLRLGTPICSPHTCQYYITPI